MAVASHQISMSETSSPTIELRESSSRPSAARTLLQAATGFFGASGGKIPAKAEPYLIKNLGLWDEDAAVVEASMEHDFYTIKVGEVRVIRVTKQPDWLVSN